MNRSVFRDCFFEDSKRSAQSKPHRSCVAHWPFFRSLGLCSAVLLLAACKTSGSQVSDSSGKARTVDVQRSSDAESFLSQKAPEAAIKARNNITAGSPNTADGLLLTVAELSLLGNDSTKAREAARSRLKSNFNDVEAMNVLIRAAVSEGKRAEAKLLVENALAADSRNAATLNLKGLIHFQEKELIEAREAWKLALKYDPTHQSAMMNLGALYFQNRNIDHAGILFERILAQQPAHLDARVGFALVRYAQGKPEEGRALLQKVVSTDDSSPLVHYNLAIIERDGFQNFPKALAHMERFIEVTARIPSARKSMEGGLQVASQLRSLLANEKQKLSDADLRSMAGSPSSGAAPSRESLPTARKSDTSQPLDNSSSTLLDRDVKSLEDAIK